MVMSILANIAAAPWGRGPNGASESRASLAMEPVQKGMESASNHKDANPFFSQISHRKAFAFEIGRVSRSCFEEDPIKLGMQLAAVGIARVTNG